MVLEASVFSEAALVWVRYPGRGTAQAMVWRWAARGVAGVSQQLAASCVGTELEAWEGRAGSQGERSECRPTVDSGCRLWIQRVCLLWIQSVDAQWIQGVGSLWIQAVDSLWVQGIDLLCTQSVDLLWVQSADSLWIQSIDLL